LFVEEMVPLYSHASRKEVLDCTLDAVPDPNEDARFVTRAILRPLQRLIDGTRDDGKIAFHFHDDVVTVLRICAVAD
jgi:hypothetical protein